MADHSPDTNVNLFQAPDGSFNEAILDYLNRPFIYRVGNGEVSDSSIVNKFGYNLDVDTTTDPELVASFGGTFDPTSNIMSSAQTFTITYDGTGGGTTEGAGTTGALTLLISYLDENNALQDAIHTLGTDGSDVTSFTGLGINRALVLSNGGLGKNANNITITATSDGTTQAEIPAGDSVTQQCIYHTPISSNFMMNWLKLNVNKLSGSSPKVTIKGLSWSRVTETAYEILRLDIDTSVENFVELKPNHPFVTGGREVIYFTAETDTNNTVVNLRFSGILVNNG